MKARAKTKQRRRGAGENAAPAGSLPPEFGRTQRGRWPYRRKAALYTGEWNIAFLARDTHRMFRLDLKDRIAKYGVLISMWSYLWALYHQDGLTQSELAQRVKLMGPSVVAAVNVMEARGLVKRVRSKRDRRMVHVFLTAKAKGLRGAMMREVTNSLEHGLRFLGNDEVELLCSIFARVRLALATR